MLTPDSIEETRTTESPAAAESAEFRLSSGAAPGDLGAFQQQPGNALRDGLAKVSEPLSCAGQVSLGYRAGLLSNSLHRDPAIVGMLAQGFPIKRTLEAAALVAGRIQPHCRSALLLLENDQMVLAAEHNLSAADKHALEELFADGGADVLGRAGKAMNAEIRPLITYASELVGALILLGLDQRNDENTSALDEICAIATVAIEQCNLAQELTYRAHHDPLTHLWNRLWIEEEIARVLDVAGETGALTGLVLVGIDSLWLINDVLGAKAGNELLRQVALRLSQAVDPGASLARGSGDEFVIVLPNVSSAERVQSVGSHLLTWFDKPFEIADHELLARASIGTAVSRPGECDPDTLQGRADTALRYAKKFERGRAAAFSACMVSTPPERLALEKHLRFALQKREFELFYQPQVHLASGKLVGAEGLLRWKHSSLGFISPGTFVPIAEEIGIIDEIGDWVIGEAMRQVELWEKLGLRGLRVAANVSALQFSRADFATTVARRLRTADIHPYQLELEVTESAVMRNFEHGVRQLTLLSSLGVCTALDDFGTGHSSLAYLQQLPVHRLKIDRMFVKDIRTADERPPLLASIIQMGHALGCSVIAEAIETQEHAAVVSALGCDEIQGFLIAKPMPAAEFLSWARERRV